MFTFISSPGHVLLCKCGRILLYRREVQQHSALEECDDQQQQQLISTYISTRRRMLSLAWLTVFIIFVYVPGSTLNVIERSSSLLLLSKSDSEATATKLDKSSVSVALVGSSSSSLSSSSLLSSSSSSSSSLSLMPGDDVYAKEKLIFKTNNNKTTKRKGEIIELNDITAVTAAAIAINKLTNTTQRESFKQEQVSDNAHSVVLTKDSSTSSPSLLLLSSVSSTSLFNIELTQPTTASTTETLTTTTTTTTTTRAPLQIVEAIRRTWNNLNDFGNSKKNNGRTTSKTIFDQQLHEKQQQQQQQQQEEHDEYSTQPPPLPPPAAQQQNRQHLQLALLSESQSESRRTQPSASALLLSSPEATKNTTTNVLPLQLTQSIQNTASVIIRGNSLNWGYVEELASSDSPPFSISISSPLSSSSSSSASLTSSTPRTDIQIATTTTTTKLPPQQPLSTLSAAASFVLSLSPGSSSYLYSSELPLTSSSSSSSSVGLSTSTSSSTSTSTSSSLLSPTTTTSLSSTMSTTSTARTTTSTTTTKSPLLSATDGYLNITSQAGTHAYLPCNVKQQLVKKPISWLRVRDGHILTVDQTTFIADQRFQSIYTPNPERWSLQIKYVQTKDAGTYECQVSTEPKTSAIVSLNIVEPKTELIGESNRHVKAGSQVKLRCIISQALEPPLYINWYHNRQQIFLHNRKGWRTEIERDPSPTLSGIGSGTTTSTSSSSSSTTSNNNNNYISNDKQSTTIASLIIPSVSKKDSGNYTCSPSNSEPITVVLHVLNGEYSASAITSGSAAGSNNIARDVQGLLILLHLMPWVVSFVMCVGQMRYEYILDNIQRRRRRRQRQRLLPLPSEKWGIRTSLTTATD